MNEEINEKPCECTHGWEMTEWIKKGVVEPMNNQTHEWHPPRPWPSQGIQLEGEEEEPEEEASLGSRLMGLLEKVRLVKKEEEKPEEESSAEESKPREDQGHHGGERGAVGSPVLREPPGPRQAMRSSTREG